MKRLLLAFSLLLISAATRAQLVLNEVSQGASGNKEFIEFVVAGTRTCSDSTMDLRGIIFDDSQGWFGTGGFNAGTYRFANVTAWSNVPYGSVILVYNSAAKNDMISESDDETDADHNYVYIVPSNSNLLEVNTSTPSASSSSFDYSAAISGTWGTPSNSSYGSLMALGNTTDVITVVDPSASTTTASHSLAWGALSSGGGQTPTISFSSVTIGGVNFYNTGSSPFVQSSWTSGSATTTSNSETPGTGNTTSNSSWIAGMRTQVTGPVPATAGAISGANTICAGTAGASYSVSAVTGASSYTWTLPSGWSGTSTSNSITVTAGTSGGSISVTANNACGSSSAATLNITVDPVVTPSVTITSSPTGAVCANTSVTFTPTPLNGGTTPSYSWYLNHTLVGSGSTYTANSWTTGDQVFAVMTSNAACTSVASDTSNTETITVVALPATPGTISGNTTVCAGSTETYSISAVTDATSYTWSMPGGWSGSSTSTSLSATAGSTSGTITVVANNSCGSSAAATLAVTGQATVTPGITIVASEDTICAGTSVSFTAAATDGGTAPSYQWLKNNSNVGTNSNSYTDNSLAHGDVISVVLTSNASCATSTTANSNTIIMVVHPVVSPSLSITAGTSGSICSNTAVSFSASATNAGSASSFDWYLNGSLSHTGSSYTASSWANGDQVYAMLTSNAVCANPTTATSNILSLNVTPVPAAPGTITGLDTVCDGASQTYTVAAVADASSYNWSLPSGWSGTSTTTSISATAGTTNGIVSVSATNACGTSAATTLNVYSRAIPAVPGIISGNTTICAGSTNTYTIATVSGASAYTWTVPTGWTITNGSTDDTVTITADASGGTISVAATNVCGTSTSSTPLTVNVAPVLTTAIGISVNPGTQICAGTPVSFSALDTNGGTNPGYQWVKNGTNVGTNSNTYTDNSIVAGDQISVVLTSNAICASSTTATSPLVTMSILPVPATPNAITGNINICPNSSNTYAINPVTGATSYIWTLPNGWTGSSTTNSIAATADATTGSFSVLVAAENECGISADTVLTVTVNTITAPAVSIAASATTICKNTAVTFTATPTNGGTSPAYQWLNKGVAIAGANSSTYNTSSLANTDSISVTMTSALVCSQPLDATSNGILITVDSIPDAPVVINGNVNPCSGTTEIYSIALIGNAISYNWTLPVGWTGSSNSDIIYASVSNNHGNIQVTASNHCGTSPATNLYISVNNVPAQPGPISGVTQPCVGSTQTYSIAAVPYASSYNWTVPGGWSMTANDDTISAVTSTTAGVVSVSASNVCGTSPAINLYVTPVVTPPGTSAIAGASSACVGTTQTYKVTPVPGFNYIWSAPTGWSGSSTGDSIVYTVGSTNGSVTVQLTGSCGTGVATTLAVTANAYVTPSASIATAATTICSGLPVTFNSTTTNAGSSANYQWLVNGSPVSGNGSSFTTSSLNSGDSVSLVLMSSLQCLTTNPVASNGIKMIVNPSVVPGINVNALPGFSSCQGSMINFVSNIKGGGSNPVYEWYLNGNLISGAASANYSSSNLNDGDTITAILISDDVCATMPSVTSNKVGVKVYPVVAPTVSITANPGMPVAMGVPVTFTASYTNGGSNPGFQWMKNNVDIPGETGMSYTSSSLKAGDVISVQMLSSDPCPSEAVVSSNDIKTSFEAAGVGTMAGNWTGSIRLYPNPSKGQLAIDVAWGSGHQGERVQVDILNVLGQPIYATELQPNRDNWSLNIALPEAAANGIYQLRLRTERMQAVRPLRIER